MVPTRFLAPEGRRTSALTNSSLPALLQSLSSSINKVVL